MRGHRMLGTLFASVFATSALVAGSTVSAHAAGTNVSVTVALLRFQDRPDLPLRYTPEDIRTRYFDGPASLHDFIATQSGGSVDLTGSVDIVDVPRTWNSPNGPVNLSGFQTCDQNDNQTFLWNLIAFVQSLYGNPLPANRRVQFFPPDAVCNYAFGVPPDSRYVLAEKTYTDAQPAFTAGNDFFGFNLADGLHCNGATFASRCAPGDDPYDILGGSGHCTFNAMVRNHAGWNVPVREVIDRAPQQYTLLAADLAANGTSEALHWSGSYAPYGDGLELEWHANSNPACAAREPAGNGLLVHVTGDSPQLGYPGFNTVLLDTHPNTFTFNDARMQVGEIFSDPKSTMRVRLDSLSPDTGLATMTVGAYGAVSMSGSDIHFVARPGDANNVHVDASSSGTWTISDVSGAPINTMSLGCSSTAANTVVCHAPAAGVEPRSTPTTGTTR